MILGMTTSTFTLLHVLISLVGIGTGLVVMYGLLTSSRLDRWTAAFITTTTATSLTGFAFPNSHITPGIVLGVLSIVALAVAIIARYGLHLKGAWRSTYVISAAVALYFNVFVLVVQSFEKAPALKALAPTQKEPPFVIAQLVVMALFVGLTLVAVKRFHVLSTGAGEAAPQSEQKAVTTSEAARLCSRPLQGLPHDSWLRQSGRMKGLTGPRV